MNQLYATFAMKSKPDDTINRIVELEKLAKEMGDKFNKGEFDSLTKRVVALEDKVNKNHEDRIWALEAEVKGIKESMTGMSSGGGTSNIDGAQILMRINMLNVEINKKIDIIVCNQQMDSMNGSIKDTLHNMTKQMESN